MQVILADTDQKPFDPVTDLRVCLAYQNVTFALRAKAMLERVGPAAGVTGRLICSLWNFKDLAEPALLSAAAADATKVELLVIAAAEGKALPAGVRDWIARWLLTKKDLPRALVANVQRDPEYPSARGIVIPYLARVAEYGQMRFFGSSTESGSPGNLALDIASEAAKLTLANPINSPHIPPTAKALTGIMASICAPAAPAPVGACQLAG